MSLDDGGHLFVAEQAGVAMPEKTGGRTGQAGIFIVLMIAVPLCAVGCARVANSMGRLLRDFPPGNWQFSN
jgi:hypothetical protein